MGMERELERLWGRIQRRLVGCGAGKRRIIEKADSRANRNRTLGAKSRLFQVGWRRQSNEYGSVCVDLEVLIRHPGGGLQYTSCV